MAWGQMGRDQSQLAPYPLHTHQLLPFLVPGISPTLSSQGT
jgi:hypothetical protein